MTTNLNDASRTCYCGEVNKAHIDQTVVLKGWSHTRRDHGGVIFVDLRDRSGVAQVVFDPDFLSKELFEVAHRLRSEDVLAIEGEVKPRPDDKINDKLSTGDVEIFVKNFEVLSHAEVIPFQLDSYAHISEDQRLKYRFLDLRRPEMQQRMFARAKFSQVVRRYLDDKGLIEVETPILTRSTPEGARDFLVPSRLSPGAFYALPQSPQLFKQILMVAGFDGYYQIAKCFRDEDLRANRQPEFTQIDIERAFVSPEDIYSMIEGMVVEIFREMKGIEIKAPFARLTYDEAMLRYGSDKPDLRFELEIKDVTEEFSSGSEFKVFNTVVEKGGVIRGLCVPGAADKYSNTQLKPGGELPEYASRYGAKGLAWFRATEGEGGAVSLDSTITKFFSAECLSALAGKLEAKPGDLILLVADKPLAAATAIGQVRLKVAKDLELIDQSAHELVWVTDFPFVEWDAEGKRWHAMHHPFTSPRPEDMDKIESDPGSVRSLAYDLALNGEEIGGGSIRIHRKDVQERVFRALGISDEEARAKFGFLLDALSYGAPPHGGIAFGVDRILMILLGVDSIRDVIPFPKTQSGTCMMTEAPSEVDPTQLRDLSLRSTVKKDKPKEGES